MTWGSARRMTWLLVGLSASHCSAPRVEPAVAPSAPLPHASRCDPEAQPRPLVTEWPASEKAHLQSVVAERPVAVRYDGCELQIIDACQLDGSYAWKQTPLKPDALRIDSKEELATKLPIGGFRLESALERNGALLVHTNVSGHFELDDPNIQAPDLGPCTEATHLVTTMEVGSFRLVGAGRGSSASEVGVAGAEVTARRQHAERLLREAGVESACSESTDVAPAKQCASPIRVHLSPLQEKRPTTRLEQAQKAGEVFVHIPLAAAERNTWRLHDQDGQALCELPCSRWLRPGSGYSLRQVNDGVTEEIIPIEGGFPVAPGDSALGVYRPQRGSPGWSSAAFWTVGAPSLVLGGFTLFTGVLVALSSEDSSDLNDAYGLVGVGLGFGAVGGGLGYWYWWSEEASFEARAMDGKRSADKRQGFGFGPGFVGGTF